MELGADVIRIQPLNDAPRAIGVLYNTAFAKLPLSLPQGISSAIMVGRYEAAGKYLDTPRWKLELYSYPGR